MKVIIKQKTENKMEETADNIYNKGKLNTEIFVLPCFFFPFFLLVK